MASNAGAWFLTIAAVGIVAAGFVVKSSAVPDSGPGRTSSSYSSDMELGDSGSGTEYVGRKGSDASDRWSEGPGSRKGSNAPDMKRGDSGSGTGEYVSDASDRPSDARDASNLDSDVGSGSGPSDSARVHRNFMFSAQDDKTFTSPAQVIFVAGGPQHFHRPIGNGDSGQAGAVKSVFDLNYDKFAGIEYQRCGGFVRETQGDVTGWCIHRFQRPDTLVTYFVVVVASQTSAADKWRRLGEDLAAALTAAKKLNTRCGQAPSDRIWMPLFGNGIFGDKLRAAEDEDNSWNAVHEACEKSDLYFTIFRPEVDARPQTREPYHMQPAPGATLRRCAAAIVTVVDRLMFDSLATKLPDIVFVSGTPDHFKRPIRSTDGCQAGAVGKAYALDSINLDNYRIGKTNSRDNNASGWCIHRQTERGCTYFVIVVPSKWLGIDLQHAFTRMEKYRRLEQKARSGWTADNPIWMPLFDDASRDVVLDACKTSELYVTVFNKTYPTPCPAASTAASSSTTPAPQRPLGAVRVDFPGPSDAVTTDVRNSCYLASAIQMAKDLIALDGWYWKKQIKDVSPTFLEAVNSSRIQDPPTVLTIVRELKLELRAGDEETAAEQYQASECFAKISNDGLAATVVSDTAAQFKTTLEDIDAKMPVPDRAKIIFLHNKGYGAGTRTLKTFDIGDGVLATLYKLKGWKIENGQLVPDPTSPQSTLGGDAGYLVDADNKYMHVKISASGEKEMVPVRLVKVEEEPVNGNKLVSGPNWLEQALASYFAFLLGGVPHRIVGISVHTGSRTDSGHYIYLRRVATDKWDLCDHAKAPAVSMEQQAVILEVSSIAGGGVYNMEALVVAPVVPVSGGRLPASAGLLTAQLALTAVIMLCASLT